MNSNSIRLEGGVQIAPFYKVLDVDTCTCSRRLAESDHDLTPADFAIMWYCILYQVCF